MTDSENLRPLEDSIERDVAGLNYGSYLQLDLLLSAQQPLSDHHDELLFIVQHQTTELWIKLVVHELRSAMALIAADDLAPALKRLARVKQVQRQMSEQWSVLATLTPTEYAQFRHVLGRASGFQSVQYRLLEFLLGNKNAGVLAVLATTPRPSRCCARRSRRRASTTSSCASCIAAATRSPSGWSSATGRARTRSTATWSACSPASTRTPSASGTSTRRARSSSTWRTASTWRFRHLKTVERIIGFKRGTGGSSGVAFLKQALELTFFPELLAARTEIGRDPGRI